MSQSVSCIQAMCSGHAHSEDWNFCLLHACMSTHATMACSCIAIQVCFSRLEREEAHLNTFCTTGSMKFRGWPTMASSIAAAACGGCMSRNIVSGSQSQFLPVMQQASCRLVQAGQAPRYNYCLASLGERWVVRVVCVLYRIVSRRLVLQDGNKRDR
jgi:hypothetical protein